MTPGATAASGAVLVATTCVVRVGSGAATACVASSKIVASARLIRKPRFGSSPFAEDGSSRRSGHLPPRSMTHVSAIIAAVGRGGAGERMDEPRHRPQQLGEHGLAQRCAELGVQTLAVHDEHAAATELARCEQELAEIGDRDLRPSRREDRGWPRTWMPARSSATCASDTPGARAA